MAVLLAMAMFFSTPVLAIDPNHCTYETFWLTKVNKTQFEISACKKVTNLRTGYPNCRKLKNREVVAFDKMSLNTILLQPKVRVVHKSPTAEEDDGFNLAFLETVKTLTDKPDGTREKIVFARKCSDRFVTIFESRKFDPTSDIQSAERSERSGGALPAGN